MTTRDGISYTDPRNINLKGGSRGSGILRWDPIPSGSPGNWATNPLGSTAYGLYINTSGQLVFASAGSLTILGGQGSGGTPSWNAIYGGSQLLTVSGATMVVDGTHATNGVLSITDTGAGSGNLLSFTNTGSGLDVNGTSSTWSFSKAGAATALTLALAGTSDQTSFSMTTGDFIMSDGKVAITNVDNENVLLITDNGNTSVSQVAFAGSGAYTGSTTNSFFTVTASGLTTGTSTYIPVVALTTGKGLHVNYAGTTSATSGLLVDISSSATAMTSTGRLLKVEHTGVSSASGAGILSEFISAATDATSILKVNASSTLTGSLLTVAMASVVTGTGINIPNVDAITTGFGVNIASAATAITTTGRIFIVSHSATTSSSGTLSEFSSAATDSTIVHKITASGALTGSLLQVSGASVVSGKLIDVGNANALTTGIALNLISTSTGITSGSLIRASTGTTGAVATNGVYSFLATAAFTSGASTVGLFHIAGASTVTGTILSVLGGAQTTGIAVNVTDPSTGMTSGSLLRVISATTGAVATNGLVSLQASGAYTSASNVGLLTLIANSTTAGTIQSIFGNALTTGVAFLASGTGVYTGTGFFTVTQSGATTGTLVQITGAGLTTGFGLTVTATAATLTTGRYFSANDGTTEVFGIGTNGHIISKQTTAPTIATNSTGLSAVAVTAGSTDTCGTITSTGTPASGTVITLTFNKTYTTAPKFVAYAPANAAAGGVNTMPIITTTPTTAVFTWPAGGVYAATPSWTYVVVA